MSLAPTLRHGICPNCAEPGLLGEPCRSTAGCARSGVHRIPPKYVRAIDGSRRHSGALARLGLMFGDYLVVDLVGTGGMGEVYLALQMPFARLKSALKLVDPHARAASRFHHEAEALASLSHPNIVRLLKYGIADGQPYLAMEFIESGRTLGDLLDEGVDRETASSVLGQMLDALAAAHALDIVHRDIKPGNVMLESFASHPNFVRVVDFGLAKFTRAGNKTSVIVGTPTFMAPEQWRCEEIGPWTDLYAVALIAYRMLTGITPFDGMTSQQILRAKCLDERPPADWLDLDALRPPAADFFRRALEPKIALRISDPSVFRAGLDEAIASIGAQFPVAGPPRAEATAAEGSKGRAEAPRGAGKLSGSGREGPAGSRRTAREQSLDEQSSVRRRVSQTDVSLASSESESNPDVVAVPRDSSDMARTSTPVAAAATIEHAPDLSNRDSWRMVLALVFVLMVCIVILALSLWSMHRTGASASDAGVTVTNAAAPVPDGPGGTVGRDASSAARPSDADVVQTPIPELGSVDAAPADTTARPKGARPPNSDPTRRMRQRDLPGDGKKIDEYF